MREQIARQHPCEAPFSAARDTVPDSFGTPPSDPAAIMAIRRMLRYAPRQWLPEGDEEPLRSKSFTRAEPARGGSCSARDGPKARNLGWSSTPP
jgi:hypothetical protein